MLGRWRLRNWACAPSTPRPRPSSPCSARAASANSSALQPQPSLAWSLTQAFPSRTPCPSSGARSAQRNRDRDLYAGVNSYVHSGGRNPVTRSTNASAGRSASNLSSVSCKCTLPRRRSALGLLPGRGARPAAPCRDTSGHARLRHACMSTTRGVPCVTADPGVGHPAHQSGRQGHDQLPQGPRVVQVRPETVTIIFSVTLRLSRHRAGGALAWVQRGAPARTPTLSPHNPCQTSLPRCAHATHGASADVCPGPRRPCPEDGSYCPHALHELRTGR
jgi:hypothetical protein